MPRGKSFHFLNVIILLKLQKKKKNEECVLVVTMMRLSKQIQYYVNGIEN